jgi:hypothetical protein
VFQADEGDRWMLLGDKPLIFKVDPVSTGSDTLVVGTEEMPPGDRIPTHKHLYEDEVIFVHRGAVHVTLADRQYEARTGVTVFIPHNSPRELDRSRECFRRACNDPILLQQTRIRGMPASDVLTSGRKVYDASG